MAYQPYRVDYWYRGRKSSTTFGSKEAAELFAVTMRKQGIRRIYVFPL